MSERASHDKKPLIVCTDLCKSYHDGRGEVRGLDRFSAGFLAGEFAVVTGPSGAGKSTLLNIVSAIDYPDSGAVLIDGTDLAALSTVEQADVRARLVSVMHSDHNLLPMLSVYENISLSLSLLRLPEAEVDHRIRDALAMVEIPDLAHRLPGALSSGERARGALARAVAMKTPVLVTDEPTAHLDREHARTIALLLRKLAAEAGVCVVAATHDPVVSAIAGRVVKIRDGRVEE